MKFHIAALAATAVAGASVMGIATGASAAAVTPGVTTQIVLDHGGYQLCLDDLSGKTAAGSPVGIWGCNSSDVAQKWVTYPDGTTRPAASAADALAVVSGKVVLEPVSAADTSQQWYYQADGTIVNGTTTAGTNNFVLNDPGYSTAPGTHVIVFNQPAVTDNAHWYVPKARYGTSKLSNRPDSGGNGNWANDATTRAALVLYMGDATGAHTYEGSVSDTGSFHALAGAFTPNQGGTDAGLKLGDSLGGAIAGSTGYSFTSSAFVTTGPGASYSGSNPSTGAWYKLFFAASTTFGTANTDGSALDNAGPVQWAWSYTSAKDNCGAVEHWSDASYNGGGQTTAAGNITAPLAGSCS